MIKKSHIKNTITGTVVAVSLLAGIKKTVDATRNNIIDLTTNTRPDNTIQPDFSQEDIFVYPKDLITTLSSFPTQPTTSMIQRADNNYKKNHLPTPDYHLQDNELQYLTNLRIRNHPIPHMVLVSGIEDYRNASSMKAKHNDLCLTAWTGENKRMNINSKAVNDLLWTKGKKVWIITHDLERLWYHSLISTTDQPSYYTSLKQTKIMPAHYHNILKQAQYSKAGDMLIFRNAASGNLSKTIPEWQQHGTHVAFSHGVQQQDLLWSQIGISIDELNHYPSDIDKQAFLIYKLMTIETKDHITRAPKKNMIWPKDEQIARIKSLLQTYPELLKVHYTISNDMIIISYKGIFVTHGYDNKLTAQFLLELIAYNWWTINTKATNSSAGWGRFLMTNAFRAWSKAQKFEHYNTLSPLYQTIYDFSKKFLSPESLDISHEDRSVLYPHIIHFDDVDRNRNRIIDKYDKTVSELLDDMTEEYFRITYDNFRGMSVKEFLAYKDNHDQRTKDQDYLNTQVRPYIKKYLEMLRIIQNVPIHTTIPIPNLHNPKVKEAIQQAHPQYIDLMYRTFEPASQQKYYDYLHKQIQHHTISNFIQEHAVIKHPFVLGETELHTTQRIIDLYDDMMSKTYPDIYTKIWISSNEQIKHIYAYIQHGIQLPSKIQHWKQATIYLPHVIQWLHSYIQYRDKLFSNQLRELPAHDIGLSDNIATHLDIHPTTRNLTKHILPRESYNTWLFNIANHRTIFKMIGESLGMDNKDNLLSRFYYIQSEWPLQIRIEDNYLWYNETIQIIKQAALQVKKSSHEFSINISDQKTIDEIIQLCTTTITKNNKLTQNEFEHSRKELKKLLSQNISINNNLTDIGSLLSIKIVAQTIEWHLRRYGNALYNTIEWKNLNAEEVNFLQQFVLKAHQFWQSDADKAFKVYMSTFLISRGAKYDYLSQNDKENFFNTIAQLSTIIKKDPKRDSLKWIAKNIAWEKDRNKQRYTDLVQYLDQNIQDTDNTYIIEIMTYLHHQDINNIPHYNERRTTYYNPWSTTIDLPHWIHLAWHITDKSKRPMLQEFNTYINQSPSSKDKQSAVYRFIISLLWAMYYYKNNK